MDCGRMVSKAGAWAGWLAAAWGLTAPVSYVLAQDKAPTAGAQLKLESTGVALAPSNTSFFSSSLNLREACLKRNRIGFHRAAASDQLWSRAGDVSQRQVG